MIHTSSIKIKTINRRRVNDLRIQEFNHIKTQPNSIFVIYLLS